MDYLAFGLLTGSLIVIVSFAVRDALPHLSAIDGDSRFRRLSRAATPSAWARWCADAGLVLAAAGTLVLLITVAALLADLSDDAGNIVVGLSVAVAVVASALGAARLWQRLQVDAERELLDEPWTEPLTPARRDEPPAAPTKPAMVAVARSDHAGVREVESPVDEPGDVWDDDLPMWSPSATEREQPTGARPADVGPDRDEDAAGVEQTQPWSWFGPIEQDAETPNPGPNGGRFSSPLLADIGLPPVVGDDEDGFRSPLLSDLRDDPFHDGDGVDLDAGSDLLLDEAPAPIGSSGRHRDAMDNR